MLINYIGDSFKIVDIQNLINAKTYRDDLGPTDLFFFGVNLGDGTDEEHFHLGMTNLALLEQCLKYEDSLFHLDSTYRILRYLLILIVSKV